MSAMHYSPNLGAMARCASPERCRFAHWDPDNMKRMSPVELSGYVRTLKNSYLGVDVRPETLAPALNQLRNSMSPDLFELISRNKSERDGEDTYHMTVVTPKEFRELRKRGVRLESLNAVHDFIVEGVGTASNSTSRTWYAVVQSDNVDNWRRQLQLPKHDLHITLGFTVGDVHGVLKDKTTLV